MEGFSKEKVFKQSPRRNEAGSHVDIRGKTLLGREKSKCQGPGAGAFLATQGTARRPVRLEQKE